MGLAGPSPLWRPALAMQQASSYHNPTRHSSCCQWGSTLGGQQNSPSQPVWQYSVFWHPDRGWSRAVTLPTSGHMTWECLWDSLSCSLLLMAAALWSRHSSKKRPHSCLGVVFQSACSLFNSLNYVNYLI